MRQLREDEYIKELLYYKNLFKNIVVYMYKDIFNVISIESKILDQLIEYVEKKLIRNGIFMYSNIILYFEVEKLGLYRNNYFIKTTSLIKYRYEEKNILDEVYLLSEASEIWKVSVSKIREDIKNNKLLINIDYKECGNSNIKIISKTAMNRLYGNFFD